jgi:hypothetical protein
MNMFSLWLKSLSNNDHAARFCYIYVNAPGGTSIDNRANLKGIDDTGSCHFGFSSAPILNTESVIPRRLYFYRAAFLELVPLRARCILCEILYSLMDRPRDLSPVLPHLPFRTEETSLIRHLYETDPIR